jgi:Uma2 family endonuclease
MYKTTPNLQVKHKVKMSPVKTKLTKSEFWQLADASTNITYELLQGEAIPKMSPKYFHSRATGKIFAILDNWCQDQGRVGIEWAFDLDDENTPVPDLLYVSYNRLPRSWNENTACPVVPELAIEIISPGQSLGKLIIKAESYLQAGAKQVWILDPKFQSLTVLSIDRAIQTFINSMVFTDELFPDLKFTVDQLFQ